MPTLLDSILGENRNSQPVSNGAWSNVGPSGGNSINTNPSASSFGTSPFSRPAFDFTYGIPRGFVQPISPRVYDAQMIKFSGTSSPQGQFISEEQRRANQLIPVEEAGNLFANRNSSTFGNGPIGRENALDYFYKSISRAQQPRGTPALNQLNSLNASRSTSPQPQSNRWSWG